MGWFRKREGNTPEPSPMRVALAGIGGPPELAHQLIGFSEDEIRNALDGWQWIGLDGLTVIAVSAFGEVFFQSGDGSIHHLDAIEGTLSRIADSMAGFVAALQDAEGRDRLLLAGLVIAARNTGLTLEAGECYDFKVAPALGGEMSLQGMTKLSFVVKLHLAGQLHQQIRALPPGTRIDKVTLQE